MTVTIEMKLPSLNEYIDVCRQNRYQAAAFKRQLETDIMWFLKKLPCYQNPVIIDFVWHEENRKRDPDNVASAKKYILDALVKAGKLQGDSPKFIAGFSDRFCYGREAKVEITIREVQKNGKA